MQRKPKVQVSGDDTMRPVYIRLPEPVISVLDAAARQTFATRSDVLRQLLIARLIDIGVVAPVEA